MSRLLSSAALVLAFAAPVLAKDHVVHMYSAHPDDPAHVNAFEPPPLRVAPGDTVRFVTSAPSHNTASRKGMIPEGAEVWNGGIDEELVLTLTEEGAYGYICLPQYEAGMVGVIVVGDASANLEAARKVRHPGTAKRVFREILARVEAE